jgi:cytochrome P450
MSTKETAMGERPPVGDWTRDFDHNHPDWSNDPHAIWDDLRARCPVAHTDRYGGVYLPVRHDDIRAIAYDTEHFSSRRISILEKRPISAPIPPVTSDPPKHRAQRMMLLPAFTPAAISELEPITRRMCNELIDTFIAAGQCDAAADYASHVPTRVISRMLGVNEREGNRFRTWIHDLAGDGVEGGAVFMRVIQEIDAFFRAEVAARQSNPRSDLIGFLMTQTIEGKPPSEQHLLGTLRLLLLAGIDTTWSSISHTLLHLARTPEHRRRLLAEPALMPTAIEEFLRVLAPVSVARLVVKDQEVGSCRFATGEMVLLPYPAANRDPEKFERPDEVVLDRQENRHSTFGLGIHRCVGSNLARMELTVAIEEWLRRIPEFELEVGAELNWSRGLVRGPRSVRVRFASGQPN